MSSAKKQKQSKPLNKKDVSLRPVTKDDTEFLFGVYAHTRDEEMAIIQWSDSEKEKFLRSQFEAQQKHFRFYYPKASFDVVLLHDKQVGYMYVDRGEKWILGIDIAMLPEYRSVGIGSLLISELLNEAKQKGIPFNIQVLKHNAAALRLYERLGFSYTGEEGLHFQMKWQSKK